MAFEDSIDNSPEVVMPKSPEEIQREEKERIKTEQVHKLVSEYISDYSDDDFLTAVAEQEGVTVDNLTDEQKQMAGNAKFNYGWTKDLIVANFVKANVPEQEMASYVAETMSFEKDIAAFEPDQNRLDSRRYRIEAITATSDSIEKLKFYRQLFDEWKPAIDSQEDADSKRRKVVEFNTFINEMSGRNRSPKPPERDQKEIAAQFATYKEIKQFLEDLPAELKNAPDNQNFVKEFQNSFFHLACDSHNPEQAQIYFQLFKDCFDKNPETATTYLRVIRSYGRLHPLTEQSTVGFENKLLPAIDKQDPQVEVLQKPSNVWGMKRGDFGIADFTVHSYAVDVNPKNINELLMALREVPTSNVAKLEQNRKECFGFGWHIRSFS